MRETAYGGFGATAGKFDDFARVTQFGRTAGGWGHQNNDDRLGRLAEMNKLQLEQALANINQFR